MIFHLFTNIMDVQVDISIVTVYVMVMYGKMNVVFVEVMVYQMVHVTVMEIF